MMRCGNERKSSSSSSPRLDYEVGLGLKMQLQPSDCYGAAGSGGPYFSSSGVADGVLVQRSFHNTTSVAGGIGVPGKVFFTATQWQELERQKTIHKYILASIPVPPQLLLPITSRSPPPASLSQCNTSGSLDLRFSSSGIDPEPWRCKRTDGKKWRCSRDVAPDQKYCERHAHKNKPRSRKLVEPSSHKPLISTTTSSFPTLSSPASYDETRCIEWFMGEGSDTVRRQRRQQQELEQLMQMPSSSRMDLNREDTDPNKNMPVYHPHFEDTQGFITLNNPYMSKNPNPILEGTQTTRHFFIDAWEKEGFDSKDDFPFSPSSPPLGLSMSGRNPDYDKGSLGIDRGSDGIWKPEWMTPVPWMNSPPVGGPLGEVLCLGNANTTRGGLDLASPHGYSYSNTNTNSSSCSKSSCEEGSHAPNFIG